MKTRIQIAVISCGTIILLMLGTFAGAINYHGQANSENHKDLLIIAPLKFQQTLQPLVDHKNTFGIETIMITMETILLDSHTIKGRDDAEKMKYYIKYAIEEYDISSVLLVGGRQGQSNKWYVPVRYVEMNNGWEPRYVSDLYFADIYDISGEFSTWDSDGDGRFGEWKEGMRPEDKNIDLYPDVALGRIPCRNLKEVETMVDKIIFYETNTYKNPDFMKFLLIAGDTYLEISNPLWKGYEGEMFADLVIDLMIGFNPTKMYLSEQGFSGPEDVIEEFNTGYGFVYFVGHGSPKSWGNHPPNDHVFIDGLNTNDMKRLTNDEIFPVCVVSGCHNCQFDVGLINLLYGFLEHGLGFLTNKLIYRYEWIPEGWAWLMTNNPNGGSIVTFGTTALGHTREDKHSFTGGINEFEIALFEQYGTNQINQPGEILKNAFEWYLDTYPINWSETNETLLKDLWVDVQVCQSYMLMGDPSLQIGGYQIR
jgi:hypothetical protein